MNRNERAQLGPNRMSASRVPDERVSIEQGFDLQSPSLDTQVTEFAQRVAALLEREGLNDFMLAHRCKGRDVLVVALPRFSTTPRSPRTVNDIVDQLTEVPSLGGLLKRRRREFTPPVIARGLLAKRLSEARQS